MSRKNKKTSTAQKPAQKKVEAVAPAVEVKPIEEAKKPVAAEVKAPVAEVVAPVVEAKTEEVKPVVPKAEEKVVEEKTVEVKVEAEKPVEKKKPGRKPGTKKADTVAPATEKKPRAPRTNKTAPKLTPYQDAVEKSRKKFSSIKTDKVKYPIAVNIELNGSVEGVFYVYLSEAGKPDVEPYRYDDYDVYVRADADAYAKLLEGKLSVYDALADGVLHVEGNVKKALMFVLSAF